MIQEYALEPELVASWHDPLLARFFIDRFGYGTGRVVSRYPKKWRRLVWEAFQATFDATAGDIGRKRIEELLAQLTTPAIRRPGFIWVDAHGWLENAEEENTRRPFHAILARDNPRGQTEVVRLNDVVEGTSEAWNAPGSIVVDRTAGSMADGVAAMLRCATQVFFVDPHFRASRPKFCNPLAAFLRILRSDAPQVTIELHTGHVTETAPDWDTFRRECEQHLPDLVPTGLTLTVRRWKNRDGGERLHNRYILTDIGGVQFGVGLDEGDQGTTDDIALLSSESYRRRFAEYSGPAHAFDLEGQMTIKGRSAQ